MNVEALKERNKLRLIFRTFSALFKLFLVTRGDALRFASRLPLAFIFRAFGALFGLARQCLGYTPSFQSFVDACRAKVRRCSSIFQTEILLLENASEFANAFSPARQTVALIFNTLPSWHVLCAAEHALSPRLA